MGWDRGGREEDLFFGFLSGKLIIQQTRFIWQRVKEGRKKERVFPHYTLSQQPKRSWPTPTRPHYHS